MGKWRVVANLRFVPKKLFTFVIGRTEGETETYEGLMCIPHSTREDLQTNGA